MTGTWIITLPYAKPPLSLNVRMHWREENDWRKQIKADVQLLARFNRLPKGLPFVDVTLRWCPAVGRRRDTDNPTLTLKSCLDGLVLYGLVEDDDSLHVRSQCEIGPKVEGGRVELVITAGEAAA